MAIDNAHPAWLYHPLLGAALIHSQALFDLRLTQGWTTTPGDFVNGRLGAGLAAVDDQSATVTDVSGIVQGIVYYCVWSSTVSSGQVLVESAHDAAFTGIWAKIATFDFSQPNKCDVFSFSGPYTAHRCRVSAIIGNGTVDIFGRTNVVT